MVALTHIHITLRSCAVLQRWKADVIDFAENGDGGYRVYCLH